MPSGGAGRHWHPTSSGGKDAARCACGEGRTAIRNVGGVPLCRQHAGACKAALGESLTGEQVRAWVAQQTTVAVAG
ncbi:MAG TPA: hypothetical protein VIU62_20550 [Chloroflexota bacterium]